jgi:hypothetical protein
MHAAAAGSSSTLRHEPGPDDDDADLSSACRGGWWRRGGGRWRIQPAALDVDPGGEQMGGGKGERRAAVEGKRCCGRRPEGGHGAEVAGGGQMRGESERVRGVDEGEGEREKRE